jgi:hypothetical protein
MEVYLVGGNGQLYNAHQTQVNGAWTSWNAMGGGWPTGGDSIGVNPNANGELEVFLISSNTSLYGDWQTSPTNQGSWSGWSIVDTSGVWSTQSAVGAHT